MRTPDTNIYVLVAEYSDGSGEPDVLGSFDNYEEADRLQEIIESTSPSKDLRILESPFWSAE